MLNPAQLYERLLIGPSDVELLDNSTAKEEQSIAKPLRCWRDEHIQW